jgi:hypothetical protein
MSGKTEESKSIVEGVFALLPDAHFDLIARICPGTIAIALYHGSAVERISSGTGIVLFLLFAYLIGFFVDVLSEFVVRDIYDWLRRVGQKDKRYGDYVLWGQIRNLSPADSAVLVKMMAEKAGFRVVAFIFFFSAILPPSISQPSTSFQLAVASLGSSRIVSIGIALACFLCHYAIYRWIAFTINSLQAKTLNKAVNPIGESVGN